MQAAGALFAAYVGWKVLDRQLLLSHDLGLLKRMLPALRWVAKMDQQAGGFQTVDHWYNTLKQYGTKEAIVFEDSVLTFNDIEEQSNRISHWGVQQGLKRGEVVALVMENRPEFIITWLGLSKIGCQIALVNNNIKARPLVHSIKIAASKMVIFGAEVGDVIRDVAPQLKEEGIPLFGWAYGEAGVSFPYAQGAIDEVYSQLSTKPTDPALRAGLGMNDTFGFIYTSGTTGLPKACILTHRRYITFGLLGTAGFGVTAEDRVYCTLPLYHSAGGGIGVGMMLHGCTLILRRKFSASQFWEDCSKYRATVVQYIGELCRYLLATPASPYDQRHKVRIAIGNGLRPEIWDEFQRRFNVPEIGEFYGATEGNAALMNHCKNYEGQGAVGRMGWLAAKRIKIAKFDVEAEVPVRDASGFCVQCGPGESGELLSPITTDTPFSGYTDAESTSKKILTDVFVKGDKYFRTGDLLKRDSGGYLYFVDRIGDTFRWKGENVSTMEVSEAVSTYPGVIEANVYGVSIPGQDGRACMAAIVATTEVNPDDLAAHCHKNLPSYSVPVFIRFLPDMEVTTTFKHKKVQLRDEGINPEKIPDKMWMYTGKTYSPFGPKEYKNLVAMKAKL